MAKQEEKRGTVAQLLDFAGTRKPLVYLGCALSAASMLLSFAAFVCIWFVARALIAVAPDWQRAPDLIAYGIIALATFAASLLVYIVALMCTHAAAFRAASNMRKQTIEHLMHVPLGFFDSNASGALRRTIDGCTTEAENLLAHKLPDSAGSFAMIVGMIAVFLFFDWRLGAACLVAAVASICCITYMMIGSGKNSMTLYQDALQQMTKTGTEYVRGIPVVKVFQQTVHTFKAFHDAIQGYSKFAHNFTVGFCRPAQTLQLAVVNGLIIFLIPTAILLAPGEADFAAFVSNFAFYAIFSAVLPTAMMKVFFVSESFAVASDAVDRVKMLIDTEALPVPDKPLHPKGNDIVLDNVTFSYEGAEVPALRNVSISVPAGSTVALVGPSGGGKSTAASLVPRFWDVDAGAVRVGGVDVRDMDPHDLMDRVAFVFQNNRLLHDTLLENVRISRPEASREQIMDALASAQCTDIVERLQDGVDTVIGAGGTHLSGGETQRVALARAILKDASIVVLDEATAFADPENEALIQRAFAELASGRTLLMIAHRLSTVASADEIVVLDQGSVVERGTHEELLAANGMYARMWDDYECSLSWRISGVAGAVAEGSVA